ncbi:MAG: hypothetical protein CSA07_02105 [Bacteroidia bacterium]|nr:MAG: hypothetical protein CSA07_02105 [Bacteroidia bacterium]
MATESCQAIVLHSTPYGERGLLIETYTLEHGARAFFTIGAKSQRSGMRYAPYAHPLALVQLGFRSKRGDGGLCQLVSVERSAPPGLLLTDMPRSAIALFLASQLRRLLGQQFENEELYRYCHEGIRLLGSPTAQLALFPQAFLLGLCEQLGIRPQGHYSPSTPRFDPQGGIFIPARHEARSDELGARHLSTLMGGGYDTPPSAIPRAQRGELLRLLMQYLEIHTGVRLPGEALDVLEDVWG